MTTESAADDISGDFETRSFLALPDCGVYKYAEHPTTGVWCFAFSAPGEPPLLWRPIDAFMGTDVDAKLRELAANPYAPWRAWNAQFERIIWRELMVKQFDMPPIETDRWFCTAAEAAALTLPRKLERAAQVLRTGAQKDLEGGKLMMKMAKPRNKPKMVKDPTLRPIWWDEPENQQRLGEYCITDVHTEMAVAAKIRRLTASERKVYLIDQRINDRGVRCDKPLIQAMKRIGDRATGMANVELSRITGGKLGNINQTKEMAAFLGMPSVDKDHVKLALAGELSPMHREVLDLRVEAGKSSVAKLVSMQEWAGVDDRMRGMYVYHGAGPGRWAAKGPQPQNFFARSTLRSDGSPILPDGFNPSQWVDPVLAGNTGLIELCHPTLEMLAMMLRACFVPAPGMRYIGGDFNAIEARVLAWLAGAQMILDGFSGGIDPYKRMAAAIYRVAVEQVTKMMRQMGKNAILGCGFGMGAEKFVVDCYKKSSQIIELDFAKTVVDTYREENPEIPKFWYALERICLAAVRQPGTTQYAAQGKLIFTKRGKYLWIVLPSRKRALAYFNPEIVQGMTPWGELKDQVRFWGEVGPARHWLPTNLYGGLLAENVTQATARDLLVDALMRVEDANYPVVLHAHDELLSEIPQDFGSIEEYDDLMCASESWAAGLPVKAEVEIMPRYKK